MRDRATHWISSTSSSPTGFFLRDYLLPLTIRSHHAHTLALGDKLYLAPLQIDKIKARLPIALPTVI